jgi:hypothetical protein
LAQIGSKATIIGLKLAQIKKSITFVAMKAKVYNFEIQLNWRAGFAQFFKSA